MKNRGSLWISTVCLFSFSLVARWARTLAPFIEKYTGAKVIIRNVTGGGGLNGMSALWKSKPDGTALCLLSYLAWQGHIL